jgi:hypothetical protein
MALASSVHCEAARMRIAGHAMEKRSASRTTMQSSNVELALPQSLKMRTLEKRLLAQCTRRLPIFAPSES